MRLIRWLIHIAFFFFLISVFMKNKDIVLKVNYFGLPRPIDVEFWEMASFCVAIGLIIAALGDFFANLKWIRERRRMIKTDLEHQSVVDGLNSRIEALETENQRLKRELEKKAKEISESKVTETTPQPTSLEVLSTESSQAG
ncbi:MAG: hypothetical protein FJY85_16790 [Deltaproteobacteria bacterium]|nr:hypothetical protein [Deltaproteobacteria bacterium]